MDGGTWRVFIPWGRTESYTTEATKSTQRHVWRNLFLSVDQLGGLRASFQALGIESPGTSFQSQREGNRVRVGWCTFHIIWSTGSWDVCLVRWEFRKDSDLMTCNTLKSVSGTPKKQDQCPTNHSDLPCICIYNIYIIYNVCIHIITNKIYAHAYIHIYDICISIYN